MILVVVVHGVLSGIEGFQKVVVEQDIPRPNQHRPVRPMQELDANDESFNDLGGEGMSPLCLRFGRGRHGNSPCGGLV